MRTSAATSPLAHRRSERPPRRPTIDLNEPDAEDDLVERATAGDGQAFDLLHRRYERLVRAIVGGEVRRGRASADVDDIVQEVFTTAWRRLRDLRDPQRFKPWLLQISRRAVIDHGRRTSCRPTLDRDDDMALEMAPEPAVGPDEYCELAEMVSRIRSSLTGLAPRDATVITMAVDLGFGPDEIGAALGITPNNAKVVLCRARARLRAAAL